MGGSASHQELLDKVIELAKIPEAVQNVSHTTGRQTKLGYNLRWAESYLGKYGALENTARGVWAVTAKGPTQRGGHQRSHHHRSEDEPGETAFRG
jgi:restriction system protein